MWDRSGCSTATPLCTKPAKRGTIPNYIQMFCTVLSITYTKVALQRTVSQNPREQATWDNDTSERWLGRKRKNS